MHVRRRAGKISSPSEICLQGSKEKSSSGTTYETNAWLTMLKLWKIEMLFVLGKDLPFRQHWLRESKSQPLAGGEAYGFGRQLGCESRIDQKADTPRCVSLAWLCSVGALQKP
jgi:hypothetical protein